MKFNINKIFPFLTIRKKLIIAFSLLSFIPLVVIGFIGISHNVHSLKNIALENLRHDVTLVTERAQKALTDVTIDLKIMTQSVDFENYIEAIQNNDKTILQKTQELEKQLINFAEIKPIYFQLRFIDSHRDERFLIQDKATGYLMAPVNELSAGRFSFYFLLTETLSKGQMAFIPVELMAPDGNTVSAISYAARIENGSGDLVGIFVADVYAKELFHVFESGINLEPGKTMAIANNEGHYLYHSKKKNDWNRLLATRENESLLTDYPAEFSQAILSGEKGIIEGDHDEIIGYSPLFLSLLPSGHVYFLFEGVNKYVIMAPVKQFTFIFVGLLSLFLTISIVLASVATNQLARPIRELQRGAEIIAQGNYSHKLNIETNDEIEQLSHQFNLMAQALGERERMLEDHQHQLEEMVDQRTEELKSEKEKLQAVLDNVPSAFLLLDQECTILSASEAIKGIAGVIPDQIIGKKCYDVFSNQSFCTNCPMSENQLRNEVYTFIEKELNPEGNTVYIEHVSIPLILNHDRRAFLEILTNITERKRIEENLVKTEKLAATGEMAAVIAHEIRNSLTSVKMILQLQYESSKDKEQSETLEVAVQSIYNMEKIINNLLGFARPASFNFQYTHINHILEESVIFIQPQMKQKNIQLIQKLNPDNALTFVDNEHLKEAFINLLLNAVQSIGEGGKISINSTEMQLDHDLKDYGFSSDQTGNGKPGNLIHFFEGEHVIRISFIDDGPGISREDIHRIFDPFFTTKQNGTGLGLTTVKRTINEHGGIIQAECKPGTGATFHIFLPIREPK